MRPEYAKNAAPRNGACTLEISEMAFPVTCPSCGKAFQLANDIYERKVAGKVVSIKCKQCQAGIRVDATKPGELKVVGATPPGGGDLSVGPKPTAAQPSAEAPKPAASPVRMRQPTLIGMVSPAAAGKPPTVALKPAAPPPALWAVDSGGTGDDRELNDDEIRREIQAGNLTGQTIVWREGMGEWSEIAKVPELARYLEAQTREETTPVPKASPPEAPAAKAVHAGFQDEPDGEATMVYDRSAPNAALEPFAAPTPPADAPLAFGKTTPLADARPAFGKTTPLADARPAFGKTTPLADARPALGKTAPLGDAPPPPPLPAAGRPAPPAPSPAARPAPPPPALPAAARPAPPAPAPPAAAVPAPAPPLPVQAAPDQPAAPPPPAPPAAPAFPSPAAQAPVLAVVPWGDALPTAKPSTPPLPTAPYGPDPFALAAATDLDFPNARSKKPLVIAVVVGAIVVIGILIVVLSSSSQPTANIAAPPPAPATATTPTETPKTPEPAPGSEAARNDTGDPTAPATQPATPSGNFSDLFSKGAEKAKGSGEAKNFDEAQARTALSGALDAAAACKEPGGPLGQSTATVTFEPSGAVSGVTVGAPFAGSSTGTCIINAFKRVKVAPFTGLPRTVSQTISLR